MGIILKNRQELDKMRAAGRIVHAVLDAVEAACLPGVTTAELNRIAAREIARAKARSAFLGYRPGGVPPYPAVLCTSINATVVHGIPRTDEILREGDIIGVDFACFKDDYCADAARTIAVGVISAPARALLAATRECLERAIRECHPGQRLGDVGHAIESCARSHGFSIVRDFVGHGIGRAMHEAPSVPNYGTPGLGLRLKPGMVIAIEPMVNVGRADVRVLSDGWTVVTADRSLSAHVEHTVAITDDGPRVLTAA
ncbi:MAG TPA: type I methionyl aminopeptidase [Polyangiaceae bacterium]|nr:type I methionyl aminopeptidase [Polyangiaceae bacterium]